MIQVCTATCKVRNGCEQDSDVRITLTVQLLRLLLLAFCAQKVRRHVWRQNVTQQRLSPPRKHSIMQIVDNILLAGLPRIDLISAAQVGGSLPLLLDLVPPQEQQPRRGLHL